MKTQMIPTNEMTPRPFCGGLADQVTHNLTIVASGSAVATTYDHKEVTMKTQISKRHTDVLGVQRPTILNPKINSGLLWQACFMLLLIAAMVVPGAAQGIYVANHHGSCCAFIGEYKFDGMMKSPSLFSINPMVWSLATFGPRLVVPEAGIEVDEFDGTTGHQITPFTISDYPFSAVVSGNHLFVVDDSGGFRGIGEYDATSGATINASLPGVNPGATYIAAYPGRGGTVNLFVTIANSGGIHNTGSIQKINVDPSTGTVKWSTTLVSGLDGPGGIAVSEDGDYVYVVIPNFGEIDEYDTFVGLPVHVPLVANISGQPLDIALSGSNLLVTRFSAGAIGEYDTSTGVWNPSLVSGLSSPIGIAVTPGDGTTFCTPPPSNMVAWYSFDQDAHVGEYDLAKGNDAKNGFGVGQTVQGKVSNALLFNGSYAWAPNKPWLNMSKNNFSIDAWVKIANPADYNGVVVLVDKRGNDPLLGLRGYHFFLYDGRLGLQLADNAGYYNYLSTSVVPADNRWHLIAVTVSRTSHTGGVWYLDGQPIDTPFDPTGHPGSLDTPAELEIGAREFGLGGGGFFKGGLDELEIFNKALSAAEVQAIYSAGSAGKCK